MTAVIHKTALIDPGARIGADVSIGPYSVIDADVDIGDGCVIGPHVVILRYTSLGRNCEVHAGAVLGDKPQDLAFADMASYVKIGDNCTIREGVTIHRGTKPETVTEIGSDCFLMAFSHFAHNVRLGRSVIVANGALIAGYVEVGDRAFISGNVVIHQFVKVGRLVMLGGGAAVSKDVPPFLMLRPASLNDVKGTNVVGLRRAGMNTEERTEIKHAFKLLYRSGNRVSESVKMIAEAFPSGPAREICDFVKASKRGICWKGTGVDIEE